MVSMCIYGDFFSKSLCVLCMPFLHIYRLSMVHSDSSVEQTSLYSLLFSHLLSISSERKSLSGNSVISIVTIMIVVSLIISFTVIFFSTI